jgi:hypothetical protein
MVVSFTNIPPIYIRDAMRPGGTAVLEVFWIPLGPPQTVADSFSQVGTIYQPEFIREAASLSRKPLMLEFPSFLRPNKNARLSRPIKVYQ